MGRAAVLFIGLLSLAGCQTEFTLVDQAAREQAFDRSWGFYQDCRSADLATILAQTPRWERMAAAPARLPVRLSVDPRALAAACAVRTGNLALEQGEKELAVELFSLVIERYPEADYAYYVAQAWAGLLQTAPDITTASARPVSFTK
jgi:hypothetical protein